MCPSGVMLQVTREYRVSILLGNGNETRTFYWCRENWPNQEMRKIYTTVLFANIYLAPLTLIVIMYARIGVTLCKTSVPASRGHSSSGGGGRHESRQMVSRKKKRVVKMLVIVALLFILSWLPLWALMMLSDYASLTEWQHRIINIYVYPLAHWLAFFNSSINPIIYGFFNENFRRGFQAAFKFQLCSEGMERGNTYSHRVQGNAVLPENPQVPKGLVPGSGRRRANGKSLGQNSSQSSGRGQEQDLIMEDLEKVRKDQIHG